MDIIVLEMYNRDMKLGILIKRTINKTYKYCSQITPARNIWDEQEFESLEDIKGMILGEIVNGYTIKQNLLGMGFLDEILSAVQLPKNEEIEVSV